MTRLLLTIVLLSASCDGDNRTLSWEVVVAPDVPTAAFFEATIRSGACGFTGTTHYAQRFAAASSPASPPVLPPGEYSFEIVAIDSECRVVGRGCTDQPLPVSDGESVPVLVGAVTPVPLCEPARCEEGICTDALDGGGAPDAGVDATVADAGSDDASVETPPIVTAFGDAVDQESASGRTGSEEGVVFATAWVAAQSFGGGGGGWLGLGIELEGTPVAETVTARRRGAGNNLYAHTGIVTAANADAEITADANDMGWPPQNTELTWAVVPTRFATAYAPVSGSGTQAIDVDVLEPAILIAGAWLTGGDSESDAFAEVEIAVDGSTCIRSHNYIDDSTFAPRLASSAVCLRGISEGTHSVSVTPDSDPIGIGPTRLEAATIPTRLTSGPTFRFNTGTSQTNDDVDVEVPSIVLWTVWARGEGNDGFVDVVARVNGEVCARHRYVGAAPDAAITCVRAVDPGTADLRVLTGGEGDLRINEIESVFVFLPRSM